MRKTALLTGVAGLFLMTAPAFAQDNTAPQTPPTQTPPAGEAGQPPVDAAQAQQQLTLQPGAVVRGSDGVELGRLEGVRNGASGQELTIRGSDGQLRGVSTTGIRQDGDAVVVDASSGQFQGSPAITEGQTTPPPTTAPDPATSSTPPASEEPTEGDEPTTQAQPGAGASTSDQPSEDTDASTDEPTGGDQPQG